MILILSLIVLYSNNASLLDLLSFTHEDRLLNLFLLIITFLTDVVDSVSSLFLVKLILVDLINLVSNTLLILLLQSHNLISTLFCLLNLLPSFDFFLFQ